MYLFPTQTIQNEDAASSGHRWLTISEAHTYCHASKARILKAAQNGILSAIKDPAWKVRQSSLDSWDGSTETSLEDEQD